MSQTGTAAHRTDPALPPLVRRAVEAADAHGFPYSCRPEQGRLLALLAAGAPHAIAETGTGCGVGLAWLTTGARPGVRLVSAERDPHRARIATQLFADCPQVTVLQGDWHRVEDHGPYDLLVLDGGGQAKTTDPDDAADPTRLLAPGGTLVVDDFTPSTTWPPLHDGTPDHARLHWLTHPALYATELRLAPDLSVIVGTRQPRGSSTA